MSNLPATVLFSCTMNSVRSAMVEGILKSLHGDRIYVNSAGVRAGESDGFMIEVMAEIDIDLSNHASKTLSTLDDTSFDLIVFLSPKAQHAAVELTRWVSCDVEYWPTHDPDVIRGRRDSRLDGYRQIRDQIYAKIKQRFPLQD